MENVVYVCDNLHELTAGASCRRIEYACVTHESRYSVCPETPHLYFVSVGLQKKYRERLGVSFRQLLIFHNHYYCVMEGAWII